MGGKKAPPKKSDEEKEAEKVAKANVKLFKAAKNDEKKLVEEALAKGAEVNIRNDNGQTAAHVAAAFGALAVLRVLHAAGADLTLQIETDGPEEKKMTPIQVANKIGEPDAAELISALLEGRDADHIGLGKDLDLSDDDEAANEGEKTDRPVVADAKMEAAAAPAVATIEVS